MTSPSLLVSSPELNLEKEICNTSYLLTLKLRQNSLKGALCIKCINSVPPESYAGFLGLQSNQIMNELCRAILSRISI